MTTWHNNPNNSPRVIVFHPGGQHSYFLAAAINKAGFLEAYITRLYYDKNRLPFSLMRLLPNSIEQKADDLLYRRSLPAIDSTKVQMIHTWSELFFIFMNRLQVARKFRHRWFVKESHRFSKRVGYIAQKRADILVGTDGASRDAFRLAKQSGVICVLDLAHPHVLSEIRVSKEEAQYAPPEEEYDSMLQKEEDIQYQVEEITEADAFIVASSFAKSTLIENGIDEARVFVVPYGVEERFHPRLTSPSEPMVAGLRVLFAGIIGQRKGVRYLLEAVHQLRAEGHDISLKISGNLYDVPDYYGPYKDDYTNLGHVLDSKLPDLYRQSDVIVLPSLFEGFARVLLEAMASGVPIMATRFTAAPDLITDGVEGYIIQPRDVEGIKERLLFLKDNPEIRQEMGMCARKTAERYTWARYYEQVGQIISSIWLNRDTYHKA